MPKMIKGLICCSLLIFNFNLLAKDKDEDMLLNDMKKYKDFIKRHSLSIEVDYKLYNNSINADFIQNTSIKAKIIQDNLFIDNANLVYYNNPKFCLTIYKARKLAVLSKTNNNSSMSKVLEKMVIDSTFFINVSNINLLADTLGKRTYSLRFKDNFQYKSCILVFDKETNCVTKNTIYYNNDIIQRLGTKGKINEEDKKVIPIMVVDYKILISETPKEFFEAKDMIVKEGNKYSLTVKYKTYKFINQLESQSKQ